MEETIRKLTDAMNEIVYGVFQPKVSDRRKIMRAAVHILKAIDALCDIYNIEFPDEAVDCNVELDEYFGVPLL